MPVGVLAFGARAKPSVLRFAGKQSAAWSIGSFKFENLNRAAILSAHAASIASACKLAREAAHEHLTRTHEGTLTSSRTTDKKPWIFPSQGMRTCWWALFCHQ
jgi:hypothetical protein